MHSSGHAWDFALAPPRIAPGVSAMAGYRALDVPESVHRGLPSSRLTFIIALDEGVDLAAGPTPLVISGLHTSASLVHQRTGQAGVQLALHPLAARAVLGMPASELPMTGFDGSQVLGRWARDLPGRTAGAAGWPERFAVVAQALARQRARHEDAGRGPRPEVLLAWHLLERSGGRLPITSAAARVGLGPRQLGALFQRELGRSPKQVAGLMRFDRAVAGLSGQLRRHGQADLGGVAAWAGFSDQAHLSREFTRYAGLSPRQWIGAELRNVQDGGHHAPARWSHD